MTWDATRQRIVLHGGWAPVQRRCLDRNGTCADTWEWDGVGWRLAHDGAAPSPGHRYGHAIAHDPSRGVTVLFGGHRPRGRGAGVLDDTWEWDGEAWTERPVAAHPGTRMHHALAWDPGRQAVVLFGGQGGSCQSEPTHACGDTWAWDGERWEGVESAEHPTGRGYGRLTYDEEREELLLLGGSDTDGPRTDSWALRAEGWVRRFADLAIPEWGQAAHSSALGTVVLFGFRDEEACDETAGCGRTLTLGPLGWEERAERAAYLVVGASFVWDGRREVGVRHGGWPSDDYRGEAGTWEWDGWTWHLRAEAAAAPARRDHAAAYDPDRGVMVVFGGHDSDQEILGDTWEWDGETWTERPGEPAPVRRYDHAMAWDPVTRRVLLHAGIAADNACQAGEHWGCDDTWAWDGERWSELPAEPHPPAFLGADLGGVALTSAPAPSGVLYAGLGNGSGLFTWMWDGQAWAQQGPDPAPPRMYFPSLAWDPARAVVALFGRPLSQAAEDRPLEMWDWTAGAWTRRTPRRGPTQTAALVADERRRELLGLQGPAAGPFVWAPQRATPHLLVRFELTATDVLQPTPADPSRRRLESYRTWGQVGARGRAGEREVTGIVGTVSAFGHGGWEEVCREAESSLDEPRECAAWSHVASPCDDDDCPRPETWTDGAGGLVLGFAPEAPQGPTATPGEVSLDYAELRVRYWRTGCEVPSTRDPDGSEEGAPCTDGDPATRGESCRSVAGALVCAPP